MIKFEASSPYPLCDYVYSESEAKAHAALVDAWLGLQTASIEVRLAQQGCRLRAPHASGEKQELWFGLEVQQLLTPYVEIRSLLSKLEPQRGSTIVDLGAAYGRMGFVIGREYPGVNFVGYEYVGERVSEARRVLAKLRYDGISIEHADLASAEFEPVAADVYFLYDYGTPKAIEKTLHDLRRLSKSRPITLVARGRHCRYLIETRHPWLQKKDPTIGEARTTIYVVASEKSVTAELPNTMIP